MNSKVYIGSSVNFWRRYQQHLFGFRNGKHPNRMLKGIVAKYGIDILSFHLVEITPKQKELILACEQKWIDKYQSFVPANGYNIAPKAGSTLGVKQSVETRAAISLRRRGQKLNVSPEQRFQNGERVRLLIQRDDVREKISKKMKGVPKLFSVTEEQRASHSVRSKEMWARPGFREKFTTACIGRSCTEETRRKISQSARAYWEKVPQDARTKSDKAIAKRQQTRKANQIDKPKRVCSEETKRKISESKKGYKWSPEQTAKRLETVRIKKATLSNPELF